MNAVILAAGQGSRLHPLTADRPKPLLPVFGETLLGRMIRQLRAVGTRSIVIVVGHMKDVIAHEIESIGSQGISLVENPNFATDTNSNSLLIGMNAVNGPCTAIEADIIFGDECIQRIARAAAIPESAWFTTGTFTPPMSGGILKSGPNAEILDLRLVPGFKAEYGTYKKLLGVLQIGPSEFRPFAKLLEEGVRNHIRQYYMEPWCKHLHTLPCREIDVEQFHAKSFNTVADYQAAIKYFETLSEVHNDQDGRSGSPETH